MAFDKREGHPRVKDDDDALLSMLAMLARNLKKRPTIAGHLTALLIRETIEVLIEVPEWI